MCHTHCCVPAAAAATAVLSRLSPCFPPFQIRPGDSWLRAFITACPGHCLRGFGAGGAPLPAGCFPQLLGALGSLRLRPDAGWLREVFAASSPALAGMSAGVWGCQECVWGGGCLCFLFAGGWERGGQPVWVDRPYAKTLPARPLPCSPVASHSVSQSLTHTHAFTPSLLPSLFPAAASHPHSPPTTTTSHNP